MEVSFAGHALSSSEDELSTSPNILDCVETTSGTVSVRIELSVGIEVAISEAKIQLISHTVKKSKNRISLDNDMIIFPHQVS